MFDVLLLMMFILCKNVPVLKEKFIKDKSQLGAHFEFNISLAMALVEEANRLTPEFENRFWEPSRVVRSAGGRFTGKRKSFREHIYNKVASDYCQICYAISPDGNLKKKRTWCSYTTRRCEDCSKRICDSCDTANVWDHDTRTIAPVPEGSESWDTFLRPDPPE